jgi:hypothetical protein
MKFMAWCWDRFLFEYFGFPRQYHFMRFLRYSIFKVALTIRTNGSSAWGPCNESEALLETGGASGKGSTFIFLSFRVLQKLKNIQNSNTL